MCFNIHEKIIFRSCMHSHVRVQKDVDCHQPDCRRSAAHSSRNCRVCHTNPGDCQMKRLPHREQEAYDYVNLCPYCSASQPRQTMRV